MKITTIRPTIKYSLIVVLNNLPSNWAWPRPSNTYDVTVNNNDPKVIDKGQKNMTAEMLATPTAKVNAYKNTSLVILVPKVDIHKPCINNGKETAKTIGTLKIKWILKESIASHNKNIVNSVNTNPTPFAARDKAIFL